MSSGPCHHCGCCEIDRDPSRGDAVCTQCGSVLEDSIIITEVQYAQDSTGATRAIGQLVSAEGNIAGGLNRGYSYGLGKESRMITLQNARKKIHQLAVQLKLQERCIDIAHNFYKMALMKKLTKGRKNSHVVAACVYMVCRKEETPHMLLDLSDILRVSVYELGKTYLRLSAALCINTPAIDPSLYILRFAHQLQFEDKTHDVSMTASRLVQRMKRDWMHTGRRPSGLCGAALLVAARLHNFSRTVDDIIKVVKVCHATVRKRLAEFGDTPSSRLTLEEFMTIDLEEEQDPPAFKAARKKKLHELEDESKVKEVTQQVSELQKLIDKALESTKKKRPSKYSKFTPEESTCSSQGDSRDNVVTEQFIVENTIESIQEVIQNDSEMDAVLATQKQLSSLIVPHDESASTTLEHDHFVTRITGPEPTAESVGLKDSIEDCLKVIPNNDDSNVDFTLDITGLDDNELDAYIMNEGETKVKTDFWTTVNAEYLQQQKEKEEKRLKEEEENANKPELKKKRRRVKRVPIQASTYGEAVEKMLQQKRISFKLNYDVLKNLNSESVSANVEEESTHPGNTQADLFEEKPLKRSVRSKCRAKPTQAPVPLSIKKGMSAIMLNNNNRKKDTSLRYDDDEQETEDPPAKVQKLSSSETSEVVNSTAVPGSPQAELIDITTDLEADEEELYEEEEDDGHMSAAQLLGHHRGEEESEYCDYQEDSDD